MTKKLDKKKGKETYSSKALEAQKLQVQSFNGLKFFWSSEGVMLVAKAKPTWLFARMEFSIATSLFS